MLRIVFSPQNLQRLFAFIMKYLFFYNNCPGTAFKEGKFNSCLLAKVLYQKQQPRYEAGMNAVRDLGNSMIGE